ncbi:MAG: hypothetical protein RIQ81_978 [Pseudomonadota bacterium]
MKQNRQKHMRNQTLAAAILGGLTPLAPVTLTGCQTSPAETKVELLPTVEQDSQYEKAWKRASRSTTVFRDFETKYTLEATYLSPEFRSAFATRAERFAKSKLQFLEEASGKSGFFVTIFSPDSRVDDLADEGHWTIQMVDGEKTIRPAFVRRLADKDRWKNFFPGVNRWSVEYMVVFDTPSRSTSSQEMATGNPVQVQFTNSDADVTMRW